MSAYDLTAAPVASDATASPAGSSDIATHPHFADRYLPILAALAQEPWQDLTSARHLLDLLAAQGHEPSERTLRVHLSDLAEAGAIIRDGKRGYRLTAFGRTLAREATVSRRLGSILYKMDETMCQLTYDPAVRAGLVSINAYVVPAGRFDELCDELDAVFRAGLAVGDRVLFAAPGETILGREVPPGHFGLGTMCSLTIASVLVRRGIPTTAVFGGLLAVEGGAPAHFLDMIRYDSTSLSPNELFIRANFTSVSRAARTGSGAITASLREAPMSALPQIRRAADDFAAAGFPGILLVGRPGQALLNIPVHDGRVGILLATGLNPLASLWERGERSGSDLDASRPMVGPAAYDELIPLTIFRAQAATRLAQATGAA